MIKKLLLGLLILVVVVVLLGVAAVAFIDPDDYREQIAQRASETLGREVRLEGPMSLSLFPWLALEIEEVEVGNPATLAAAPPLARIGKAVASVRVMPLLRGVVETGTLTLSGAELTIVTGPDGQSNLDGLLAEPDPAVETPALDLTGINLGSIVLEQVAVVQLDLVSGDRTTLAIERMRLAAFAPEQPLDFSLGARLSDSNGDLLILDDLSGTLWVARDLSVLRIDGLAADYRLPGSDIAGEGSAGIEIQQGARTTLVASDLRAALEAAGHRLGLSLSEPLRLELGEAIDLALNGARLSIDDQTLQASGRVRLDERFRADLTLTGEVLDLRPFTAAGSTGGAEESASAPPDFSGLDALAVDFRLDLEQLILSDQLRLTEVVTEARLIDARLELAPMQARLFGGRFDGRVEVDFTSEPPAISLQPALSGIAISELAELSGSMAPLSGLADAELTLDFSGLELGDILASLNGSGRIEIANGALEGVDLRRLIDEELTVSNLSNVSRAFGGRTEFDSLTARIDVVDGVVELPDLDLSAAGYGIQGQGRIDFAADRIDYRLRLDLGPGLTQR
ncbi:MAG: AsmA family protein, partial [Wenzhouxiangella sp.]|nr:AsmA family protein [Wenzhouxiangella sp.]